MIDMELNITKIVEDKMQEMAEQQTIEKLIGDTVESSIRRAVEGVLGGYDFRVALEQKFRSEVSEIVNDVGLSAYNQYIADTFRRLTEVQMKEEIKEKIATSFENIFVKKREQITLSELVKEYKSYLRDVMDEYDNEDDEIQFHLKVVKKQDSYFESYQISLELDEDVEEYNYNSSKTLIKVMDKRIWDVHFNGQQLNKLESLRYMNDFECLLASLFFNKTDVEVDLEEGTYTYEL